MSAIIGLVMSNLNINLLKQYEASYGSDSLLNNNKGIEKEGLRVDVQTGSLAQTDHDEKFGSKLLHKWITTDFAESLLEFITPVSQDNMQVLSILGNLQNYVLKQDETELIWPSSMPVILPEDDKIKLAYYGESNSGKLKTLYRSGLGLRYGRSMQAIAGLHYNFSMQDEFWKKWHEINKSELPLQLFINEQYLNLCRNFRKYSNILLYLFGNSVAVHESFLKGKKHNLVEVHDDPEFGKTYGTQDGVCLRMGGLGYTGASQDDIRICYNGLDSYCDSLEKALQRSYPPFEEIGLRDKEGKLQQISTSILQIENEFYSIIRPKRVAPPGKSALASLRNKGIEYIEVRLLDLNPFAKNGITLEQANFLDAFLLTCLFIDAKKCNADIYDEIIANNQTIVKHGRSKDLTILDDGQSVSYPTYLKNFFDTAKEVIGTFVASDRRQQLLSAIDEQEKYLDSTKTLSSQVYELVSQKGHIRAMLELAKLHRDELKVDENHVFQEELVQEKGASVLRQIEFEELDDVDFEEYVAAYVASSFSK